MRQLPTRAIFVFLVSLYMLGGLSPVASAAGSRVSEVRGSVDLGRGDPVSWETARVGAALQPGDSVRTGSAGRAELEIDGSTVRLYENSLLRLPPGASSEERAKSGGEENALGAVRLDRGRSLFDVLRRGAGRAFEVKTPEVVVSVKGTRFAVDASSHAVAVFRGEVGVRGLSSKSLEEVLVRVGFSLSRLENGVLELHTTAIGDPWGAWGEGGAFPASLYEGAVQSSNEHILDMTREAARAQARPEAIKRAMEQSPRLRRAVMGVVAERAGQVDASGARPKLDGVLDLQERVVDQELAQRFAEIFANGGSEGGSTGGSLSNFTFTFLASPGTGSDQIMIEEANSGLSTIVPETLILNVLQGGATFDPTIRNVLNMQGLTQEQLAQALVLILNAN